MPGMMDTILNLGLNDEVVVAFAKKTNNPRFAYDSYRRFIQMYSDVVMEVGKKYFEQLIDEMKEARGVTLDTELTAEDLKELAEAFKAEYKAKLGVDFPQDPKEQLMGAVKAVFRSWDNPRAIYYRRMNDIPSSWGTAVNVQSMVFGNMGETSGTGVAFTRNPATGEKKLFGEFLMNAQGEDVVAGVRTPQTIDQLAQVMPEAYAQFVEISQDPREPLPRHAGHGVHHRGQEALHAPDPQRQAYRCRRHEDCLRPGRRRHDLREGSRGHDRSEAASTPCCTRSSTPTR